eukprot:CAMPEP_0181419642 /NCGR_PEP_ID=MMETSP1110-20121109/12177_1 /TAXON_ID=174948 /ORGANISM="Symbiodinium sp., Strain CCMP421" /LENGTH=72 /DNA_ID=CAMNT_0023542661 /DNA_START=360 /DNA_END=578 /DNA_ORIENTATION=-
MEIEWIQGSGFVAAYLVGPNEILQAACTAACCHKPGRSLTGCDSSRVSIPASLSAAPDRGGSAFFPASTAAK